MCGCVCNTPHGPRLWRRCGRLLLYFSASFCFLQSMINVFLFLFLDVVSFPMWCSLCNTNPISCCSDRENRGSLWTSYIYNRPGCLLINKTCASVISVTKHSSQRLITRHDTAHWWRQNYSLLGDDANVSLVSNIWYEVCYLDFITCFVF